MARITINGISIDPLAQGHLLTAIGLDAADTARTDYILVQVEAPLTEEQRATLADLGVEIQEYVPEDTYLCRYRPADLGSVRALPFVAWAGVYLKAFKIPPSLRGTQPAPGTAIVTEVNGRGPSRKPRTVDIVLHDGVDLNSRPVREAIAAAAGVDPASVQAGSHKARVTVEEGQLNELAALDEVRHIEPVPDRQLFNSSAPDPQRRRRRRRHAL
jgi:serine protease AprX